MSGVSLSRNLSELAGIAGRFDELERAGTATAPLMRDISLGLVLSTQRRFELEQSPEGKKWKPFSPVTLYMRAGGRKGFTKSGKVRKAAERKMNSAKLLRRTGRLFQSITAQHSATVAMAGTNVIYAAIHNFGGPAGRGKKVEIPARPYFGISSADEAMISDAVSSYYGQVWGGA